MASETVSFASLKTQLTKGTPAPVYLLHGEEGYFIDEILKLAERLSPEADRDFDLYTLYAPQITPDDVMTTCRRYPMMAPRQVVIVKEVQAQKSAFVKALKDYLESPSRSTTLFLACRGETFKGTDVLNALRKGGGVAFESKKMRDGALASAIQEHLKNNGLSVDPKALSMLTDFVGTDLSRIYNEIDKLSVTLGSGAMVTPEAVERNIGISKDYNNFELVAAIASRDTARAMAIVDYFKHNPRKFPPQPLTPIIFNLFSNILIAQYADDKSERGLMAALGFRWPAQLKDVNAGLRNYRPAQVVEILSALREFDGFSKGNGSRMNPHDLLQDVVFRILTTGGRL